jgi:hypothetical protein
MSLVPIPIDKDPSLIFIIFKEKLEVYPFGMGKLLMKFTHPLSLFFIT